MMRYLDNAATSAQKPFSVIAKMWKETLLTSVNAGRGAHRKSLRAVNGINKTAESLARLFNIADPSRIAFLPNATYALNLGMLGVLSPGDHVVVTAMDHNSVLRPAALWGNFTIVPAEADGFVDPVKIEKAIRPETALVVCTHASNVCGTVQDIEKICDAAHRGGALFMLDAAQSAGCMELDAEKPGADLIAFSGHKGLLGPLGTGGLYAAPGVNLRPVITGGTGSLSESLYQPAFMPDILHSGTMNTPAIMALGTAADIIENPEEIFVRERELAKDFVSDLKNMDGVVVYGTDGDNRNGTVSFNAVGADPAEIEEYLDREHKIIVRAGYHCAPLAHKALGSGKAGSVRVSFGYFSTDSDRMAVSDAIYDFLKNK